MPSAVLAANLPDFEALVLWPPPLGDKATYLLHHRGWSHSLVGIAAEVLAFVALLWGLSRWRRTAVWFAGFTVRRAAVLVGSCAASHLFLDWCNTYGVRPFYPWDKTWYYGDLLFIVDPWVWLILAAAVVCGTRRFGRTRWLWATLLAGTTGVVVSACWKDVTPWFVLVGWVTGVAEIAALRWWGVWRRAAVVGWGLLAVYVGSAVQLTDDAAASWERGASARDPYNKHEVRMVSPVPGVPWRRAILSNDGFFVGMGSKTWAGSTLNLTVYDRLAEPLTGNVFVAAPGWGYIQGDPEAEAHFFEVGHPSLIAWRSFARVPLSHISDGDAVFGDARYRLFGGRDWSELRVAIPPDGLEPWMRRTRSPSSMNDY